MASSRSPANGNSPDSDDPSRQDAEAILRRLAVPLVGPFPNGETTLSDSASRAFRAEARYRMLVEQIPAITFMAALDDGLNEMYVSPQIEKILGYSQKEWLEDPVLWYTRLHPEDRERWHIEFARTCASGKHFRSEYRFLARDGHVVWVHGEAQMFRDERGRPLFLHGVAFDITEQKRGEAALQRTQSELEEMVENRTAELSRTVRALHVEIMERKKTEQGLALAVEQKVTAEAASRAKNEFLSRMSHELRTPLNAILGFGQLLELETLTASQRECVEQIKRGGQHLLGLINEVLDIARIEAGRMDVFLEPVRVADACREVFDLVQPLGARRRLRFHLDLTGADTACVMADHQRLKQVLLNLLSNAVKYNRDEGEVRLSYEEAEAGRRRLVIDDTGPGIPANKMARLFIPFDRLGAEHTGADGIGLGLPLSKSLVELMGGTLIVSSTVGQGSRFAVELAQAEALPPTAREQEQAPESPLPSLETRVVLSIEDNPANRCLIQQILAIYPGIHLLSAPQGSEGLNLARQHRPDLILLDVHLPDQDGEQVLRQLHDDPQTRSIPVVVISADASAGQIQRLLAAGARHYLTKPIEVPRLLRIVNDILRRGAQR